MIHVKHMKQAAEGNTCTTRGLLKPYEGWGVVSATALTRWCQSISAARPTASVGRRQRTASCGHLYMGYLSCGREARLGGGGGGRGHDNDGQRRQWKVTRTGAPNKIAAAGE